MTNTNKKYPIRFQKLRNGSKFRIIAEPSRGIKKSNDSTTYVKVSDAWSHPIDDENKAVILMPQDVVLPLSRGDFN